MEDIFEISFDFPIIHSSFTMPLRATVQLHQATPFYAVDSFFSANHGKPDSPISLLPRVDITYLKVDDRGSWVHTHSGRESLLSQAIGRLSKVATS